MKYFIHMPESMVLGLELRAYTLTYSTNLFFVMGFFRDLKVCVVWLRTVVFLISAS
jgi:hypothetical protein